MPLRRGSARSHAGCAECKRRRVKCDEGIPACRRCRRHGRECSIAASLGLAGADAWKYASPDGSVARPVAAPTGQTPHARADEVQQQHPVLSSGGPLNEVSRATDQTQQALSVDQIIDRAAHLSPLDRELLTSYLKDVAALLNESEDVLPLFQITAPTLALTRPYLMYSILAISGIHRLATRTKAADSRVDDSKLRAHVLEHQNRSLQLYQAKVNDTATTDDCVATCMACIFILIFTLSSFDAVPSDSQHPPDDANDPILDKACQMLRLQAGISAVFLSRRAQIETSALKVLLDYPLQQLPESPAIQGRMQHSLARLAHVCASPHLPPAQRSTYLAAVAGLGVSLRYIAARCKDVGNRLGWVVAYDARQLAALVAARAPGALLVMAHWAALLAQGPRPWWEHGFGRGLVASIGRVLPAPERAAFAWLFDESEPAAAAAA